MRPNTVILCAHLSLLTLLFGWAGAIDLRAQAPNPTLFAAAFWGSAASLYAALGAAVAALL